VAITGMVEEVPAAMEKTYFPERKPWFGGILILRHTHIGISINGWVNSGITMVNSD